MYEVLQKQKKVDPLFPPQFAVRDLSDITYYLHKFSSRSFNNIGNG